MIIEGGQEFAGEQSEAEPFGAMLRSLRRSHGLNQRTLASSLGMPQSDISMLERSKRRPPRLVSFYENLRQVAGIEESEVVALRRAKDAPVWLINDQNMEEQAQRASIISEPEVDVELRFHVDPAEFNSDELDALQQVVVAEIKLVLRDFLRREEEKNNPENPT